MSGRDPKKTDVFLDRIMNEIRREFFIERVFRLCAYASTHPESYVREVASKAFQRDVKSALWFRKRKDIGFLTDDIDEYWHSKHEEQVKRTGCDVDGPRKQDYYYAYNETSFDDSDFEAIVWEGWNPEDEIKKIESPETKEEMDLEGLLAGEKTEVAEDFWKREEVSTFDSWRLNDLNPEEQAEIVRNIPMPEDKKVFIDFVESCLQSRNISPKAYEILAAYSHIFADTDPEMSFKMIRLFTRSRHSGKKVTRPEVIAVRSLERMPSEYLIKALPTINYLINHKHHELRMTGLRNLKRAAQEVFRQSGAIRKILNIYSSKKPEHIIDPEMASQKSYLEETIENIKDALEPETQSETDDEDKIRREIREYFKKQREDYKSRETELPELEAKVQEMERICNFQTDKQDLTGQDISYVLEHFSRNEVITGNVYDPSMLQQRFEQIIIEMYKDTIDDKYPASMLFALLSLKELNILDPELAERLKLRRILGPIPKNPEAFEKMIPVPQGLEEELKKVISKCIHVEDDSPWEIYRAVNRARDWNKQERKYPTTPPRETEDGYLKYADKTWADARILAARFLGMNRLLPDDFEDFFKRGINDIDPDMRREVAATLVNFVKGASSECMPEEDETLEMFYDKYIRKRISEGCEDEKMLFDECVTIARSEIKDYKDATGILDRGRYRDVEGLIEVATLNIPGYVAFMKVSDEGGSSIVYRAWDKRVYGQNDDVAIKLMKPWEAVADGVKQKLTMNYEKDKQALVERISEDQEMKFDKDGQRYMGIKSYSNLREIIENIIANLELQDHQAAIDVFNHDADKNERKRYSDTEKMDSFLSSLYRYIASGLQDILDEYKEKFRKIFIRDIRNLENLHHPNVASIKGKGEHGERVFITQPYYPEGSLEDIIHSDKPFDALSTAKKVIDGICYLHERRIVHRDLKPANIFMTGDDNIAVVGDLQTCMRIDEINLTVTEDGEYAGYGLTHGTQYGSPEINANKQTLFASDIYSMGLILWEMTTKEKHRVPKNTDQDTHEEAVESMLEEMPENYEHIRPIIKKCLQYDPSRRYHDAKELKSALIRSMKPERRPSKEEYEEIIGHQISEEQYERISIITNKDNDE